jgi:hypothetical protein
MLKIIFGVLAGIGTFTVMYLGYILIYGLLNLRSHSGQVALGIYAPFSHWWFWMLSVVLPGLVIWRVAGR